MKIYRLILLPILLLLYHCNMDPFQPGRPGYDGGTEDGDTTNDGGVKDSGKD